MRTQRNVCQTCLMDAKERVSNALHLNQRFRCNAAFNYSVKTQPYGCSVLDNYCTFAIKTGKGCISMDTTADKTLSVASVPETQGMEQNIKDWAQYSQWIAAAMSKRMSELGLTQKMLAGKMGCTQQYISKVLKGKKNMSLETICKIENALGIEIIKNLNEISSKRGMAKDREKIEDKANEPVANCDQLPMAADIQPMIRVIRGQQVIIDRDLALLYGVETRALNQAVKRNIERFPDDFMFQLDKEDVEILKSQNVTSSWGGDRRLPYAFTEQGIAMLSSNVAALGVSILPD